MADQEVRDPEGDSARRLTPRWVDGPRAAGRVTESVASLRAWLAATFEREVDLGRATLWLPVLFGAGIGLYFTLPREPSLTVLVAGLIACLAAAIGMRRNARWFRLFLVATAILAGLTVMKARTDMVAAPIIVGEYVGDLTGWVEEIEQFSANARRLVVRVVSLEDVAAEDTPFRVRITVRGRFDEVHVGAGITGLVGLQTPPAPVMPGGYDFGRELFYERIGASGFSYGPPDLIDLGPPPFGVRLKMPIAAFRASVGARIEAALPGETGQIANALITGDRGGISDATAEALRQSGLAHILAISGLHMALVAGAVFGFLRGLFALSPALALRRPIKKWAAIGAIVAAVFYLVISGAGIATQRSFIMLTVMLVAVLLDRRAFSVRNVAVAATIVLLMTPEALLSVSFQMSFAATLALIAGFEAIADRRRQRLAIGPPADRTLVRTALFWIGGLILTSLLAGLATAPFAAFHFNRTAPLSLFANLAAVPVFSFLVMPMALASMLLMPFGLEGGPLWLMGEGIDYVLSVAGDVADRTGTSGLVPTMPTAAILLIAAGLLWLCLWRTRWRIAGAAVVALGIVAASFGPRPDILIEDTGEVVAVRAADGRYRVIGSGANFEVETWLRTDADPRPRNDTTLREAINCDPLGCTTLIGNTALRLAQTLDHAGFADDCRYAAIVVTPLASPGDCAAALVIDAAALSRGGAHAIYLEEGIDAAPTFRVVTTRPELRRPWMPPLPDQ